jgi:hypothetical protein
VFLNISADESDRALSMERHLMAFQLTCALLYLLLFGLAACIGSATAKKEQELEGDAALSASSVHEALPAAPHDGVLLPGSAAPS